MAAPNATSVQCRQAEVRNWTKILVRRALMQAAGSFEVSVADAERCALTPGATAQLWRGSERLIAGYVDAVTGSFGRGSMQRTYVGRDATGDLADCAPDPAKKWVWRDAGVVRVVNQIAQAFDIKILVLAGTQDFNFPEFSVAPGESAWLAIERALRLAGLVAYCDRGTRLAIGPPAAERVSETLEEGRNVLEAAFSYSLADRYSKVTVLGQRRGTDNAFADAASGVLGQARDDEVPRERELVIFAEGPVWPERAQRRAQFEVAVRRAEATSVRVVVEGWERAGDRSGPLWAPNQRPRVVLPSLGLDEELLVDSVEYLTEEGGGDTAAISLVSPQAYVPREDLRSVKGKLGIEDFLSEMPELGEGEGASQSDLGGDLDGLGEER